MEETMFGKKTAREMTRLVEENAQLRKSLEDLKSYCSEQCVPKGCCQEKKATKKAATKSAKPAGKNVKKNK